MFYSTESDCPSYPNLHIVEQALRTLKQTISSHLEHQARLEKFCSGWQQNWLQQFDQLRIRIETLEARIAPWMTDRAEGPRLAMIPQHEDVA